MLTHFVYIHVYKVYNMYTCNEYPDETAQTPFLAKTLHQALIMKTFQILPRSNINIVYWLRDITAHQTLFRTANVHARIPAEDQTLLNTIPSNEGSYEIVPVHNLTRM